MQFAPDVAITNQFWRCSQGNGIVLADLVDRIVSEKFTISTRRFQTVNSRKCNRTSSRSLFVVTMALAQESTIAFDFLDTPLSFFKDCATKTLGYVLYCTELTEGGADCTFNGGGESLKGEIAVGVPSKGAVLEKKGFIVRILMRLGDDRPDAVLRGDEGTGEKDGNGIDGVVHMGEITHSTFFNNLGFLDTVKICYGFGEASVKLGEHTKEVVSGTNFLGNTTGNKNGTNGLTPVCLEPTQNSAVGELGDGRGLSEHTFGHTFDLVDREHFKLVDTLLKDPFFLGN